MRKRGARKENSTLSMRSCGSCALNAASLGPCAGASWLCPAMGGQRRSRPGR